MPNYLTAIWDYYQYHLNGMMLPFHPILKSRQDLEDVRSRKYRWHYAFPFSMGFFILADILVNLNAYGDNPRDSGHFHHAIMKFMPDLFLKESAKVFLPLFMLTFCFNLYGLFDTFKHTDFILLHEDGKLTFPYRKPEFRNIDQELAKRLLAFDIRSNKLILRLMRFLAVEISIAYSIPVAVTEMYKYYADNGKNAPGLREWIVVIVCPFYFRALNSDIRLGCQFMCQNSVIHIKQKYYLEVMTISSRLTKSVSSLRRAYYRWRKTIGQILDLTREIEYMNRFYSKYITTAIIMCCVSGCAILNTAITRWTEAPFLQVAVWFIYGSLYLSFVFFFNSFSSRTILLNFRLFKRLRQLQITILSARGLNSVQIVKLDLINEYKIFLQKSCCFKMLNSAPINNKLFAFQIFGYVSVFWMKLVADNRGR